MAGPGPDAAGESLASLERHERKAALDLGDVGCRDLESGEMAAALGHVPVAQVVESLLDPATGKPFDVLWKHGDRGGHGDRGTALGREVFPVDPGRGAAGGG